MPMNFKMFIVHDSPYLVYWDLNYKQMCCICMNCTASCGEPSYWNRVSDKQGLFNFVCFALFLWLYLFSIHITNVCRDFNAGNNHQKRSDWFSRWKNGRVNLVSIYISENISFFSAKEDKELKLNYKYENKVNTWAWQVKLHFVVLTCSKLHWEWTKENILNWIYLFDRFPRFKIISYIETVLPLLLHPPTLYYSRAAPVPSHYVVRLWDIKWGCFIW